MPLTDPAYALVEAYASLGDHRTGTSVDAATVDWFASELASRGAAVERRQYSFDRYDASWDVRIAGESVVSLPLFYEGVGAVRTDTPTVGEVDAFTLMLGRAGLDPFTGPARAHGSGVAVVATTASDGDRLLVPNRAPISPGDVPVVLVSGATRDQLKRERVEVDIEARIVDGESCNVIARFGEGPDPLIVATPLSGWFACAGERGTGIAVALELAPRLAGSCPVVVVGTTGHELVDLGLERLLASVDLSPARAVLHLGACVAAAQEPGMLSRSRICNASVPDAIAPDLSEALGPLDVVPNLIDRTEATDPARWIGEARGWCSLGTPLVSLTGYFPYFHTPEDVPDVSTSPDLLARVSNALSRVGHLLCER